jgi:hypothetical protein
LIEQLDLLPLSGVDRKAANSGEAQLHLSGVYTALLTEESDELTRQFVAGRMAGGLGAERPLRRSALEQLNQQRRLVLLGDPGSGKSAFVNFVALCHAGALLDHAQINLAALTAPLPPEDKERQQKEEEPPKPQPWKHGPLLPLPGEKANAGHLWAFLSDELAKVALADFVEPLRAHLLSKGGLVLFDGLDEVPEADAHRLQIKQAVEDFAASFAKCRLLVTSRTYAYQNQAWQLNGFSASLLAPFSNG